MSFSSGLQSKFCENALLNTVITLRKRTWRRIFLFKMEMRGYRKRSRKTKKIFEELHY